jgi:hypothetical protein
MWAGQAGEDFKKCRHPDSDWRLDDTDYGRVKMANGDSVAESKIPIV